MASAHEESRPPSDYVTLQVRLPSGNRAVYTTHRRHMPIPSVPSSFTWPIEHGALVAHEQDGRWYTSGGWVEIVDAGIIQSLEDTPMLIHTGHIGRTR